MNPDEAVLLRRSQRGDREAFGQLVIHYQNSLFNAVFRMCGNQDDAADIVQETFLKAFRAIRDFRGRAAFYTWLLQIAMNTTISQRRRDLVRKESKKLSLSPVGEQASPVDPADKQPGPDSRAQQAEVGRRITEAIDQLDHEHRIVVVLKDIEGLGYEQIAQVLGCPRGTVKSRLHRARLELRAALGDLI